MKKIDGLAEKGTTGRSNSNNHQTQWYWMPPTVWEQRTQDGREAPPQDGSPQKTPYGPGMVGEATSPEYVVGRENKGTRNNAATELPQLQNSFFP